MEAFLFQATIYLLAAVVAVPIAARLGLGSVLGYLIAGIVIGPVVGLVGDTADLQHFAEFGVVMMLFIIGLELEPHVLWSMRHRLLGLGGLQILLTTGVVCGAAMAMGHPWPVALAIGLTLSLSSTAIVLQTLSEKGLMQTTGGRSAFSVLLSQDIAVIPMLAAFPLLAISGIHNQAPAAHDDHGAGTGAGLEQVEGLIRYVDEMESYEVALVTLGVLASIILFGIFLTRPLFRFIHAAKLREMYTATALLIVVGIACVMLILGISPALGAFLAGVVLANTEFRHELESNIEPFKGLLLGLFFITVGAGIDFTRLWADLGDILGLTLLLMLLKGGILFALGTIFRLRGAHRWLFTLSLAQAGEFGFVLLSFGTQTNVFPAELSDKLVLVVALSMLLTPLFFILYEVLARRSGKRKKAAEPFDEIDTQGPIIIAGIGRFGQVVNRVVRSAGFETVVLDNDLNAIQQMRRYGYKSFFGDPTRPELLHAAGLKTARVLVVAMDDEESAVRLTQLARRERPDLHIVARAHDRSHVYQLYQAGANDIVRELFDSSLRAGRYVLENSGLDEYEASVAEQAFYKHDRYAVRELAKLWKPGVPPEENPAYLARVRELEDELHTTLLTQLDAIADSRKANKDAAE
ncbi:Glutathione-regulated potassium-efflux system protein KefC [Pseudoruegeria aquimaris]|uniref:Glutathione-regulated potassium-efflux system protein KefC n=1 Tax=Pseudoruegeria aquimaris TaxID=393663 RepID=A0A1Y5RWI1_9RHOB|nr:cation:proton antiporter [Pseudoruegeria aquimaris]SLN26821.1 Glutathione-regulated potassium-efflux system protein KefC [Pseudoruegeria aquimaris]